MSIQEQGLIMEGETPVTKQAETPQAEPEPEEEQQEQEEQKEQEETPNTSKVKKMSDRINEIRNKEVAPLKDENERLKAEIAELRNRDIEYKAAERGISVHELRAEMDEEERQRREAIDSDPEVIRLRQAEFERQKADVLHILQKEYPEDNITDIEHFPAEFYKMLGAGVHPARAYGAVREEKPQPATAGSVKTDEKTTGRTFTREEVQGMSVKEVQENYDAIVASKKNW